MRPSHVKRINKKITETKGEKKHESILSKIFLQRTILVIGYYTSCLLKNSFVSTTPSLNIDSTLHLQQMVTILSIFYTSHLLKQPNVYSFS